jgi:DNA ligase D-like protein (predicted 3'-phosphoesterase)
MTSENKKFVIQEHSSGQNIHWDFMLQIGDVLQTYRLDKSPQELANISANAIKIFDHPLKFLTYEGPVNKGRGRVSIADSGTYRILNQSDDCIELDLKGKILKGSFTLSRVEGDNWQFGKSDI